MLARHKSKIWRGQIPPSVSFADQPLRDCGVSPSVIYKHGLSGFWDHGVRPPRRISFRILGSDPQGAS